MIDFVKNLKIPLPPLDVQTEIVARIEEEQKLVDANKKLIELFEGKIKEKSVECGANKWYRKKNNHKSVRIRAIHDLFEYVKSADFPTIFYPQIAQISQMWGHIGKRPRAATVEICELSNENRRNPSPPIPLSHLREEEEDGGAAF